MSSGFFPFPKDFIEAGKQRFFDHGTMKNGKCSEEEMNGEDFVDLF